MAAWNLLGGVLRRLVPGGAALSRRKQRKNKAGARGSRSGVHDEDIEISVRPRRRFVDEASQGMAPEDEPDDSRATPADDEAREKRRALLESSGVDVDALQEALLERQSTMTEQEKVRERNLQNNAIRKICQATSVGTMFELMDSLIDEEWLGGCDELPGNIYSVGALSMFYFGKKITTVNLMRRMGFGLIFIIQLIGPPLIFFQFVTNKGIEDEDHLDWSKFHVSLSDWSFSLADSTKLMALLFVTVFCLNGLFCQHDEKMSWAQIDRIFRILEYNGQMKGTSELALKLGAFMNCWVIIWLELDVFIALGLSESVQEVLMDALGLTFIFNLDDIGGDLGFIDNDDWPGTQLAWVSDKIHVVADEFSDIDEVDESRTCMFFLHFTTLILGISCVVLPIAFVLTPFQELKAEPWYEEPIFNGTAGLKGLELFVQATVNKTLGQ